MRLRSQQELFEQIFGSNKRDGAVNLNEIERSVAEYVCSVASGNLKDQKNIDGEPDDDPDDEPDDDPDDEPDDYDEDAVPFDKKIEAAMENFKRVVELFKLSSNAKDAFLKNFKDWSSIRENNVRRLKEIAEEIQSDKFNSDIAKVVGGVVGVVGGIVACLSFLTPLAIVTVPLAIGGGVTTALGSGVVVGTTVTEIVRLKNKLEEAKTLAEEEMENFSTMEQWFTHTKDLKEALKSLIDCDLLSVMAEDLKKFNEEVEYNLDSVKEEFRDLLTTCIGKMCKQSKIVEIFGVVFAPVVMAFVFVVCLFRDHNRIVLECILQVERFAAGLMSTLGIGVQAGRLTAELATKGAVATGRAATVIVSSVFIAIGIVVDVINVVISSIDIHNCTEPEHVKKIKDAAELLEKEFSFIKSVYDELEKWESIDIADVKEWKTFIIKKVPHDTVQIDIKMAIKSHLSEEAWSCIKLQRDSIDEKNWLFKVPASNSEILLQKSHLIIKGERCEVTEWSKWKTFVVLRIPDNAGEEDIKMCVRPHLPEKAWGSIYLQKLSTGGNNWLVKVLVRYSQNLVQLPHIIVNGEQCLIMQ